jgi:hypothetical protein
MSGAAARRVRSKAAARKPISPALAAAAAIEMMRPDARNACVAAVKAKARRW